LISLHDLQAAYESASGRDPEVVHNLYIQTAINIPSNTLNNQE